MRRLASADAENAGISAVGMAFAEWGQTPGVALPCLPLSAIITMCLASLLAGCATMETPTNLAHSQYQVEQQLAGDRAPRCAAPEAPALISGLAAVASEALADTPALIGPGDRLKLVVSGDTETLSGQHVITANGRLVVPGVIDLPVAGRTLAATTAALRAVLVERGLVRDIPGNVVLAQVEQAGVQVSVEGAVFEPGLVRAGERTAEAQSVTITNAASGDFNTGRSLATALRLAGGIRPDAAADGVYLVRGGQYTRIDLIPAFTGGVPADPQLAAGDRIIVPSTGCFNPLLVRPSSVTAPGIRVYMSNLSRPASHNSAAAIGKDSTSLPYGTRLVEGLLSANCVGGSAMNAARQAVLISRNPVNRQSVVIARSVEALVRNANRDDYNPWLMPGDGIACYDSGAMTVADAIGVVGNALVPVALVRGLTK
jgi:protein involved in polysaccharide export with SLBB domain